MSFHLLWLFSMNFIQEKDGIYEKNQKYLKIFFVKLLYILKFCVKI